MKYRFPNMDEVLKRLKARMENAGGAPYAYVLITDIRILIEERERLSQEYADERAAHNSHVTELIASEKRVAEQDKEIQALKGQNTVLDDKLTELESSFDECTRCSLTIVHK